MKKGNVVHVNATVEFCYPYNGNGSVRNKYSDGFVKPISGVKNTSMRCPIVFRADFDGVLMGKTVKYGGIHSGGFADEPGYLTNLSPYTVWVIQPRINSERFFAPVYAFEDNIEIIKPDNKKCFLYSGPGGVDIFDLSKHEMPEDKYRELLEKFDHDYFDTEAFELLVSGQIESAEQVFVEELDYGADDDDDGEDSNTMALLGYH